MADRRVVITGLGVVTPAGAGLEPFREAMLQGKQCIGPITRFDPSGFDCRIGGQIEDFSARKFVPRHYRKAVKLMARDIEIAIAAADLAVKDAGLVTRVQNPTGDVTVEQRRFGCNIGAGLINTDMDELGEAVVTAVVDGKFNLRKWGSEGMTRLTPLWLLKYLPNMPSCHVTIIHGCEGPSNAITCGAASGHLSVGEAARWIQRDNADAAIAGGAESKINSMGLLRQRLLNRLCTNCNDDGAAACRPFDADHRGTAAAEGGALILLEELDHARRRGAGIYAELVGFGAACDSSSIDITKPNVGSLDLAVTTALKDADITPQDVSVIVAHGTGVPAEDVLEAGAWLSALGETARKAPAVTITGSIGSLFAGAGAVELAAAALALHEQTIGPSVNFAQSAPGCDLNLSNHQRSGDFEYAVTGAFSIGGQSAACVLKKYQE